LYVVKNKSIFLVLVIGFGLLVLGYWFWVIGFGLLVLGYWFWVIGFGLLVLGYWLFIYSIMYKK
jgi:hypothetical protein